MRRARRAWVHPPLTKMERRDAGPRNLCPLYGATVKLLCNDALESSPTHRSKRVSSCTHERVAALQYVRSALSRLKCTVFVSPGATVTRWKPFTSRTGRELVPDCWCKYSCATSSAVVVPLF